MTGKPKNLNVFMSKSINIITQLKIFNTELRGVHHDVIAKQVDKASSSKKIIEIKFNSKTVIDGENQLEYNLKAM